MFIIQAERPCNLTDMLSSRTRIVFCWLIDEEDEEDDEVEEALAMRTEEVEQLNCWLKFWAERLDSW